MGRVEKRQGGWMCLQHWLLHLHSLSLSGWFSFWWLCSGFCLHLKQINTHQITGSQHSGTRIITHLSNSNDDRIQHCFTIKIPYKLKKQIIERQKLMSISLVSKWLFEKVSNRMCEQFNTPQTQNSSFPYLTSPSRHASQAK